MWSIHPSENGRWLVIHRPDGSAFTHGGGVPRFVAPWAARSWLIQNGIATRNDISPVDPVRDRGQWVLPML